MTVDQRDELLAVVTMNSEAVGGDIPIFFADNQQELEQVSSTLAQILKAMVHDMGKGVYIIVRH